MTSDGAHFGPRPQNDATAANSAKPDTDRPALWDDPDHAAYVLATDPWFYYSTMYQEYMAQGNEAAAKEVEADWRARCDEDDEDEEEW